MTEHPIQNPQNVGKFVRMNNDVYNAAIKKGVAVCPGDPFYEYDRDVRTMRLNYSNASDEAIEKGVKILGEVIKGLI